MAQGRSELVVRVVEQEEQDQEDHLDGEEGGRHVVRLIFPDITPTDAIGCVALSSPS